MSIALSQKVRELERKLAEALERIAALESKPKPGRPPKAPE